jgi:hypothetical protein
MTKKEQQWFETCEEVRRVSIAEILKDKKRHSRLYRWLLQCRRDVIATRAANEEETAKCL